MKEENDEIAVLSSRIMTKGLKLIMFTYVWGKCVNFWVLNVYVYISYQLEIAYLIFYVTMLDPHGI